MEREGNVNIMDTEAMKEVFLRKKIKDFVNKENAFKNFDKQVKERVLGQKNLSQVTYNVFMWLRGLAENCEIRNNAIIVAPSGCGKTETYRTIRDILKKEIADIPVVQLDATKLTAEGFKGMDTDEFMQPIITKSVNGIAIVVLDEIDKRLLPDHNASGDNVNASIQSQLLTLIEGTEMQAEIDGEIYKINTANTLFVAAGAFQFIRDKRKTENKINERNRNSIGFHSTLQECNKKIVKEEDDISLEEIIEYGAMNEFIGRFTTVINLHKLDLESVKKIICRYAADFGKSLKCTIMVSDTLAEEIYQNYLNSGLGCRILRNQLWNRIAPIGMEIEINNHRNEENEIKIICDTREDLYIIDKEVHRVKKEYAA